ncbi:MAG TPA: enoyl-CoA hydratase/isomerase family protein [Thermoanaerobaculia bacterium]|jgi:cyclohexa-1,5-dienecarbonyl-CoA hydratase|nr:enoyl-CoA hydratase/isomerase family protein [Thermoanaerobaculia bacterium]
MTPAAAVGIGLQRDGRVATLTLSRPPLNILDLATLQALERGLGGLTRDRHLDLLVVRGAGERAFSAGVAVQDHVGERIGPALAAFHGAIRELRTFGGVTLACVNGHCLGGGLELALACDLVVASDDATFGLPEITLGCYPPVAAALLPRWIGRPRALELLLTGRTFDAAEAERLGLLTRRVAAGKLDAGCAEITAALLAQSGAALRLAKRAAAAGEQLPFAAALGEAERIYLEELVPTADMNEGIAAFLEKRKPRWKHR